MHRFANPARFMALSNALQPWVWAAAAVLLAVGTYWSLFVAPADYQQGETVRIMFIHVPAAWTAVMVYSFMALASAVALIWRHPLADVAAKVAAPIGACFTFLALVTGSLWGKPMWGAWWVWDARLTSVLVLFLLYLAYMAIWRAIDEPHKAGRIAAILALAGFINVPIIKFSVEWWNTLHQPASVLRFGAPTVDPSMLWPLLIMALGYTVLFAALQTTAMRGEILKRRIRAMRIAQLES